MTRDQLRRLDKCYFDFDINSNCKEETVDARRLVCPQRFDLYSILLYIDHKVRGVCDDSYALSVYKDRTLTITGFKMSEPGNDSKSSFDDYLNVLDHLIEDVSQDKFENDRTLIPVDKNYVLIDGAHRTSCAAYFDKQVKVLRFLDIDHAQMSSEWFRKAYIPEFALDAMALEACNWHKDLFMLILWPKAHMKPDVLSKALEIIWEKFVVVYKKDQKMSYAAIRNLMIQIYGHMDWVGGIENDFASTFVKADEVWDNNGMCSFILIKAPSCEFVLDVKNEIRDMFGIGLASIHSTDTMRETRIAANAIFNPNSLTFLHKAKPTRFKESYRLMESYKSLLEKNHCEKRDFIIDSSMMMAIYGIRSAGDLDYYSLNPVAGGLIKAPLIEEHDESQKSYYNDTIEDLIISPNNYFSFNELKYVTPEKLLGFKKNRYAALHDPKDKNDIVLLSQMINSDHNRIAVMMSKLSIVIQRKKRIIRRSYHDRRRAFLISVHLYEPLKKFKKILLKK